MSIKVSVKNIKGVAHKTQSFTVRLNEALGPVQWPSLPPANEVCQRLCFYRCLSVHMGGACVVAPGEGVCFFLGGHAWFFPGGACMVFPGGHAWFFPGGVCGCSWGVHGFFRGVCVFFQGACVVFSGGGHA